MAHPPIRLMAPLLLGACAGPLQGRWVGDCDLHDQDRSQTLAVSIYIADDSDDALRGSADIDGHDANYELEGTHQASAIAFTLHGTVPDDGDDIDPQWWLNFTGTMNQDADPPELNGTASYWTEIYEGGVLTGDSDPWEGECHFDGLD